jgi:hypothetical protein
MAKIMAPFAREYLKTHPTAGKLAEDGSAHVPDIQVAMSGSGAVLSFHPFRDAVIASATYLMLDADRTGLHPNAIQKEDVKKLHEIAPGTTVYVPFDGKWLLGQIVTMAELRGMT